MLICISWIYEYPPKYFVVKDLVLGSNGYFRSIWTLKLLSYICLINHMDVLSWENFQGFSKLNPKGVTYIFNNFPIFIVFSILNNVVTYNLIFYTFVLTCYSLFYDIKVNFVSQVYVYFNMFLFKCLSLTFQFACDVQKKNFMHERKIKVPFPHSYLCTYVHTNTYMHVLWFHSMKLVGIMYLALLLSYTISWIATIFVLFQVINWEKNDANLWSGNGIKY
jgi:hypothetical protein